MIEQIEGLTAVICGHQHRNYCGVLNGVAYTEAGIEGEALSCIDINTENGVVIPRLLQVTSEPDEKILAMVRQEEDRTQQWLDTPLGHTPMNMKITSEFADRYHKNQLATFINRVQMELTGADLSGSAIFFKAPGFAGGITMRDLISTYMFPNTLVVKKINGRILREYLEKCLDFWSMQDDRVIINPLYDEPNIQYHNYDMIDGVEYTADIRRPSGSRLVSLTRNGREVRDEDEMTLAINNYRASGGGNFDMIANAPTIRDIPDSVVDILAEYIIKHGEIDFEPVDNIRIIP